MIDIDKLNEAELVDLNHRVVARLKFLEQMRAHGHMLDFSIGQKVVFQTVTVVTDNGQQWRVSPQFLRRVVVEPQSLDR